MRRKDIEKLKGDFEFSRDKFFFHTKGDFCEKIYSPFSKGRFEKKFDYPFDEGRFLREKIFSPFRREILKRESPFEFSLLLKGEKNYQREKILDIPGAIPFKILGIRPRVRDHGPEWLIRDSNPRTIRHDQSNRSI